MRILSNPHTHTTRVDGKNTAMEMAARAVELGFTSIGISEHAVQRADLACALDDAREELYIQDVLDARRAYEGRLRVWLGAERDRISYAAREKYDYVIGASHYFPLEDGDVCGVDGDPDALCSYVARAFGGDWMRAAEAYYRDFAEYIATYKPDIIAHFDLFCKSNRKRNWFDEKSARYLRAGFDALSRMREGCDVMELNTGGIARSGQPCPYPIDAFLVRWRELGGRVIVSSDCHRAHQMDAWFEHADEYLRAAGFRSRLVLGDKDTLFEEVAL